jgi:hypothetical protein
MLQCGWVESSRSSQGKWFRQGRIHRTSKTHHWWWRRLKKMEASKRLEEKHATNLLSWCTNYRCLLHRQDIGWSRLCVSILGWSWELWRTIKHTIVYPGSGPCYEVIALHLAFLLLKKMNSITMGVNWELKKFTKWKGEMFFYHDCTPCLKGMGSFIDREAVG